MCVIAFYRQRPRIDFAGRPDCHNIGLTMRISSRSQIASTFLLASALCAQDCGHGEAKWAKASGLSVVTVHRLWRSTSHFADEKDDVSQILLLDAQSLAARNRLLMVTAAGLPTCLTVAVFSKSAGNLKAWSEASTPDGQGFCETLGIEPEVRVANGEILVKAPIGLTGEDASRADGAEYSYSWTGSTYPFGHKEVSLEFVPASQRPR